MFRMDSKEEKIVDAAVRVFSRYGVRRTTMNDIASEAGIARQTLYNVYSNKDEVLRATIRLFTDRSLAAIEANDAVAQTLDDKLDVVFEQMVVRPFEILSATPDADDIINGFNEAGRDEISIANERYRAAIESILAPFKQQISASGLTTHQLSDFVRSTAKAFKRDAENKKHLLQLLEALKVLVLKITKGS